MNLEELKCRFGFREPDRGLEKEDADNVIWRFGKMPDYTIANESFLLGKTQNHKAGSLEEIVETLVKTWEFEASHKSDINQWKTIDLDKYCIQTNGGPVIEGRKAAEIGNYNALLIGSQIYQNYGLRDDFEASHEIFRDAFTEGFPWEVLKVLQGPPDVIFTWRHWGKYVGTYRGNQGNGETVEMFGMCRVGVDSNLKIGKIDAFFDPDSFLRVLEGSLDASEISMGKTIIGDVSRSAIEKATCPRNKK